MASREDIQRFQFLCEEIAAMIRQFPAGWIFDDLVKKLDETSKAIGVPPPISFSHIRDAGDFKIRIRVHQIDTSDIGEIYETRIIWASNVTAGETSVDEFEFWNSRTIFWLERWNKWVGGPLFQIEISDSGDANNANVRKLFPHGVPDDPDIVDLVVRLDADKGTGKSMRQTAREYTGENVECQPKADRLLARIRMMKSRGKLNL